MHPHHHRSHHAPHQPGRGASPTGSRGEFPDRHTPTLTADRPSGNSSADSQEGLPGFEPAQRPGDERAADQGGSRLPSDIVSEFGDAHTLARAFIEQSAGRRIARSLLATGPLVGACWAAALLTGRAWTWPVPGPAGLGIAAALIVTIAVLARLALGGVRYRPLHRAAAAASALVLAIDLTMVMVVVAVAPTITVPLGIACAMSASRLVLTVRRLPILLRRTARLR